MKRACGMDPQRLWEYQESLLSAGERREVERHLETCADCRSEALRGETVFAALKEARPRELPAGAQSFRRPVEKRATVWTMWRWPATVAGLAVLAVVAVGLFDKLPQGPPEGTVREGFTSKAEPEKGKSQPEPHGGIKGQLGQAGAGNALNLGEAEDAAGNKNAGQSATGRAKEPTEPFAEMEPPPHDRAEEGAARKEVSEDAGTGRGTRVGDGDAREQPQLRGGGVGGGAPGPAGVAAQLEETLKAEVVAYDAKDQVLGVYRLNAKPRADAALDSLERDKADHPGEVADEVYPGAALTETVTRSYLHNRISFEAEKQAMAAVAGKMGEQAAVSILVEPALADRYLTVDFENAELNVALAAISFASQAQWADENGKIRMLPRGGEERFGFQGRAMEREGAAARSLEWLDDMFLGGREFKKRFSTFCPTCGKPDLGPMWNYCPFCGKPLPR